MTYLESAIDGCLDDLHNYSGSRNTELFRQASRLYTFVLAGVVGEGTITHLLTREANAMGLGYTEIRDTLKSAQRAARRTSDDQLAALRDKCNGQRVEGASEPICCPPPETVEPPSAAWQERLRAFVGYAQGQLDTDIVFKDGLTPGAYLQRRGLSPETIAAAGLGYNPKSIRLPREQVGIEPEQDERGRWLTTITLPQGIVIPWFYDGHLWRVSVRTDGDGGGKYRNVRGGTNALYNADVVETGKPVAICEGVFDALAIWQETGDLVAPVACGTTGARRMRWLTLLARAPRVLLAFDDDPAGRDATTYWLSALGDVAREWKPLLKDPAEMLQAGLNLRVWIDEGITSDVCGIMPSSEPFSWEPDTDDRLLAALGNHDYDQARELVSQTSDPRGAAQVINTHEREFLVECIRNLWEVERRRRWLTPMKEISAPLDSLTLQALRDLQLCISERLMNHPEESKCEKYLPDGWMWRAQWQAWHPTHGKTSLYLDRDDAVRETKRHSPAPARRQRTEQPGDLFGEVVESESERPLVTRGGRKGRNVYEEDAPMGGARAVVGY